MVVQTKRLSSFWDDSSRRAYAKIRTLSGPRSAEVMEGRGWRGAPTDTFIPMVKGTGGGAACWWRRQWEARAGDEEPRATEDERLQKQERKLEGEREEQNLITPVLTPRERAWLGARESCRWLAGRKICTRQAHRFCLGMATVSLWVRASR